MSFQDTELLLTAAVSGLVLIGLYAMWLWLQLWFTRQVFRRMAVISANNEPDGSGSGFGCGGVLLVLLIVVLVIGLLLSLGLY